MTEASNKLRELMADLLQHPLQSSRTGKCQTAKLAPALVSSRRPNFTSTFEPWIVMTPRAQALPLHNRVGKQRKETLSQRKTYNKYSSRSSTASTQLHQPPKRQKDLLCETKVYAKRRFFNSRSSIVDRKSERMSLSIHGSDALLPSSFNLCRSSFKKRFFAFEKTPGEYFRSGVSARTKASTSTSAFCKTEAGMSSTFLFCKSFFLFCFSSLKPLASKLAFFPEFPQRQRHCRPHQRHG